MSTELIFSFRPQRPGRLDSRLEFPSNDPNTPIASFQLDGTVRERCRLVPWPPALDFKLSDERSVSILNATDSACQITELDLDLGIFEVMNPPSLPHDLGPHEELVVNIRHHTRTLEPHVPVRTLRVRERESDGADVRLIGAYPIWNCLDVQPREYEYPETAAGSRTSVLFSVTNRCTEAAEITSLGMPYGAEAFGWEALALPTQVPSLGHAAIEMHFRPPDGLDYAGRLRIGSNDAAELATYVGLLGRAIGPVFSAPNLLDLGAVPAPTFGAPACATPTRRLPIFNLGSGALFVHALTLEGADAAAFRIDGVVRDGITMADWTDGFEIPPHGQVDVLIQFAPSRDDPSDHEAQLLISHTPETIQHAVELRGRAFGEPETIEYFDVTPAEVDVLFVVDGSRSMRARHQRLVAEIESFIQRADAETTSNHVALISTRAERPDGGRLLACRFRDPVLRSTEGSANDRATDFICALGLNEADERKTAGLFGAALAMSRAAFPPPFDPTGLENQRFLRSSAHLALIFVSDEDDLSRPAPERLLALYQSAKGGRLDRVRPQAIVVPPGQTCVGERYSVPGERYAAVSTLAGGSTEDICENDLGPALSRIADRVFAPPRDFALSSWADPSSISVFVNGVPAVLDPESGYDLNRETNTIVFGEAAAPLIGSRLEIHYRSICAP